MAKIRKKETGSVVPAGMLSGVEAFYKNNTKYLIINGTTMEFENAPTTVQGAILKHYFSDSVRSSMSKEIACNDFATVFNQWYKCRIGGLDSQPDFTANMEEFNPDNFNNQCTDYTCTKRGKWCNNAGLKHFHMPTIKLLIRGYKVSEIAEQVNLSIDGVKSQIKQIKEITGARNVAHLSAIVTSLGMV